MATWKRVSGEPVTTQSEVAVWNPETGEEGYVGVSWGTGPAPKACRLLGPVVRVERFYGASGTEIAEPRKTVIDATPTFA